METTKLRPSGTHSLVLRVPPVLARSNHHEAGDEYEVMVTPQEIRYRKLSPMERDTLARVRERATPPA